MRTSAASIGIEVARGLRLDLRLTDHVGEDLDRRALGLVRQKGVVAQSGNGDHQDGDQDKEEEEIAYHNNYFPSEAS